MLMGFVDKDEDMFVGGVFGDFTLNFAEGGIVGDGAVGVGVAEVGFDAALLYEGSQGVGFRADRYEEGSFFEDVPAEFFEEEGFEVKGFEVALDARRVYGYGHDAVYFPSSLPIFGPLLLFQKRDEEIGVIIRGGGGICKEGRETGYPRGGLHHSPNGVCQVICVNESVYQLVQQAIVSGELVGGQRVRDVELAAQLGVSRTPVREALQRLEDEGLVETLPGSLTRVVPLGTRAAQEAFPVVAVLHGLATRLAVETLTEVEFAILRQANESLVATLEAGDVTRAVEADDRFHGVFVRASGNSELGLALERLMPKVRRLEYAQFGSLAGHTSVLQHRGIIEACEQKRAAEAALLTEQNWLQLGRLIVESFDNMG